MKNTLRKKVDGVIKNIKIEKQDQKKQNGISCS